MGDVLGGAFATAGGGATGAGGGGGAFFGAGGGGGAYAGAAVTGVACGAACGAACAGAFAGAGATGATGATTGIAGATGDAVGNNNLLLAIFACRSSKPLIASGKLAVCNNSVGVLPSCCPFPQSILLANRASISAVFASG